MALSLANMTKREQSLGGVGVAAVLLLAAYWYFLYKPKAQELTATQVHVDSLDRKNQQAKADIATGSLQKLRAQSAEYEQSLKVMRHLVAPWNELPHHFEALLVFGGLRAELLQAARSDVGFRLLILPVQRIDVDLSSSQLLRLRLVQEVPVRSEQQHGGHTHAAQRLLALG